MAGDQQLHVSDEIAPLERKLTELRSEIYRNLRRRSSALQVARSSRRPFTLRHYVRRAFTDFIEAARGSRLPAMSAAIVGGWARLDGGGSTMVIGHQRGRDAKE